MTKFLVAFLLGLALFAVANTGDATAVQSGPLTVTGYGEDGSGSLTIAGSAGTGYCVHARQADGSYARQASGQIPSSGSVTMAVSVSVTGAPNETDFYIGYGSGGPMTWITVTPNGDDDGWWLW